MIGDLLSRLDKVRRTSPESWVARCPSHDDRLPSLTIRETPDGRVLLHCFAGCDTAEVLSSVGMAMEDLFPERLADHMAPLRVRFPARDVLECVAKEVAIAHICASDMARGNSLSAPDRQRLGLATQRLQEAIDVIRG